MAATRPKRARHAPNRNFGGEDNDRALRQALRLSVLQQKRPDVPIPEAPVLHPTPEEFSNKLRYMRWLRDHYGEYGIVKVVPPPGMEPRSKVEFTAGRFSTKRQSVHRLQEGLPFEDGDRYNGAEYKAYADGFTEQYLSQHRGLKAGGVQAVEEEFWRLVETSAEEVVVDYANDIGIDVTGTFFDPEGEAGAWDLNHMARSDCSALCSLEEINGVTRPWMYFGNLFTTFCWHTEDHFLYSANYLHAGAPKTWYGIPEHAARKFEAALGDFMPARLQENPDLIYQLITLVSPKFCKSRGVDVYHLVQTPGTYVVTFPRAYHAGFSHGWNSAEAVNFATLDWFPSGREAVEMYRSKRARRGAIFAHDKLLWTIAWSAVHRSSPAAASGEEPAPLELQGGISPEDWSMLHEEVAAMWEDEAKLRGWLRGHGMPEQATFSLCGQQKMEEECAHCSGYSYLSVVRCKKHGKTTCLQHAYADCDCEGDCKVLEVRVADMYISEMVAMLRAKAKAEQKAAVQKAAVQRAQKASSALSAREGAKRLRPVKAEPGGAECALCGLGGAKEEMLLCASCDHAYHRECQEHKSSDDIFVCQYCRAGQ